MIKLAKILFLLLYIFQACICMAQNAVEDLIKVNQEYLKYKNLSMTISYNVYLSYTSSDIIESETGLYQRKNNIQYSNIAGFETLYSADNLIVVDPNNKMILICDPVEFKNQSITGVDIENMLSICNSVKYSVGSKMEKVYRLDYSNNKYLELSAMELFIDSQRHIFNKIVIYYNKSIKDFQIKTNNDNHLPRLEIVFTVFDTNPDLLPDRFKEDYYIKKTDAGIFCSQNYSNYQLINHKID